MNRVLVLLRSARPKQTIQPTVKAVIQPTITVVYEEGNKVSTMPIRLLH